MVQLDFNNKALPIRWSAEKNQHLVNCRLVSFEEILLALSKRKLIKIITSPTHIEQNCLVVDIRNYAYVVPYVEDDEKIFLKTIYPSRKFTKYFLRD
ncbi:MAG: toxin [Proteobacteria bacterium]|nr:toxin [Pseudomonadota bacterium]